VVGAGVLGSAADDAGVAVTVVVAVEGSTVGVEGSVVGVEGDSVGVEGVAVVLLEAAALLVTLLIALWTALPHPAARHPAARIATRTRKPLLVRRILVPPHGPMASSTSMIGLTGPSGPHPPRVRRPPVPERHRRVHT
jgi:hypothetical protein